MDLKKDMEEWAHRRRLLEALLVSSISKKNSRLPTVEEFILSEVVNGTIDYAGGKSGQMDYQRRACERNRYEFELFEYFQSEMQNRRMDPNVLAGISKLCEAYMIDPTGPDRPYSHTELYSHFKGSFGEGICKVIMISSFSMPVETVLKVGQDVLPSFSSDERRDIIGIGKAMRKYIDQDLEYIGENYRW